MYFWNTRLHTRGNPQWASMLACIAAEFQGILSYVTIDPCMGLGFITWVKGVRCTMEHAQANIPTQHHQATHTLRLDLRSVSAGTWDSGQLLGRTFTPCCAVCMLRPHSDQKPECSYVFKTPDQSIQWWDVRSLCSAVATAVGWSAAARCGRSCASR